MQRASSLISVAEFTTLLQNLSQKRPDICLRYRLLGEMWMINFMSIILVSGKGMLLNDDVNRRVVTISDLTNVMQFEIDRPFEGFQPYFHYEVQPLLDKVPTPISA